jgi:UDP-GlcNAc:undecaprenyl-phosphate GlcNAc-1-phosphate transferase
LLILALATAVAMVAGLMATRAVARFSVAYRLFDLPDPKRRVHVRPTPRLGGIAVFAAMACGLTAAFGALLLTGGELLPAQWRFFAGILIGGGVVFSVGVVDDLRGVRPAVKVAAQVGAAVLVYLLGFQVEVLSLGGTRELTLGWLGLPLTILWIVGVTNSFNLIDGMDGLAAGIALVALLTTLTVALALGNLEVALVCATLSGALLGFLRYNFSPAQIFLGDSGSLFVGFMLAVLSVHGSLKTATAVLVLVPLSALAIPLLDTGIAIVRRWLRGVPLSGADARHIHHRLLAVGMSHRRAAMLMYGVAIMLAAIGVSLVFAPPTVVTGVALAGGLICLALLLYGLHHLDYHEFTEAGAVLVSGAIRVRRVIQDQIHARDLCQLFQVSRNIEELRAVLSDNAGNFGFVGLTICEEVGAERDETDLSTRCANPRAWKLDYPVVPVGFSDTNPFVLRIWCDPGEGDRPLGALRVARILAPALSGWLVAHGILTPGYVHSADGKAGVGLRHLLPASAPRAGTRVRRLFSAARGPALPAAD